MDKKKIAVSAAFIAGVILFIVVMRGVGFSKIVDIFAHANKLYVVMFLIASFAITLTLITRWYIILSSQHVHIPFWKVALFKSVGFSFSYLTPTGQLGGEGIRGILLKKEKVAQSTAFSSVMIDKFIELSTHITFACIGFIFIILNYQLTQNTMVILLSALAAAVILLSLFYYRITRNKGFISSGYYLFRLHYISSLRKYEHHIRDIEVDIANFFRFDRKVFKAALGLSLFSWILMFCEYETALLTFGYSPSILALFLVICVIGFAYIVPVPATLGVLEISQASLFTILHVNVGIGIALGLLIRMRDVLWALFGLAYLFGYKYFSTRKIDRILLFRFRYGGRKAYRVMERIFSPLYLGLRKTYRTCKYKIMLRRKRNKS